MGAATLLALTCGPTTDWNTFLSVQAGAAATLTGLVFVAASLNLQRILEVPGLSGRAAESILQLLQVFFVSSILLVPAQPTVVVGAELLGLAVLFWIVQLRGQIHYWRTRVNHPLSWFVIRALLSQLAILPFCVAGGTLLFGMCNGIYLLVPGFLFSFAAAMLSAWVLLIEILR